MAVRQPEAHVLALKLVSISDIVVENFSGGAMDRLGLGYEELRRVKSDIIMASLQAFGQTGPRCFCALIDLLVGELRRQIRVEANPLSGQDEGTGIPLPNEWGSFRGEEPNR